MTDREKAIVMAHTGICMLTGEKFNIFHSYVEELIGRPVVSHEIGLLADTIKEKSKTDFIKICDCEDYEPISKERIIKTLESLDFWIAEIEGHCSDLLEDCEYIQNRINNLIQEVKEE